MRAHQSPISRLSDRNSLDVGVESPIEAEGGRHAGHDRRNVSLRWLLGIVLTGLCGAALMGAAIYVALDRQSSFAEDPTPALPQKREASGEPSINPRKGDRLVKSVDIIAARQNFRAATTIKIGDKEVLRSRGFTRISTTLTLAPTGFADDVPAFNPLKLLADQRNPDQGAADPGPLLDNEEVSFVTRDLASADLARASGQLSIDEIQAQITEHLKNVIAAGAKPALPLPPQLLLMRTSRAGLDPTGGLAYANPGFSLNTTSFSSIEVRMVPENVTLISKDEAAPRQPAAMQERLVIVHHNETLDDILRAQGAGKDTARAIIAAFGAKRGADPVVEGQKLKFLLADLDGLGKAPQIARVSVYSDEKIDTVIAVSDSGAYLQVRTDTPAKPARKAVASADDGDEEDAGGMRLYNSLYESAMKQEIPRPLIDDLVRVFGNDVDFQRPVSGGDSFDAFYEDAEDPDGRSELLYASITTRSEVYRYYRYQPRDDNSVDYYDENGRSVRKFLIRKPITSGELRSGFGMRYHPILRYSRPHTGVDWSNPIGTPILAAGNGTIIKAQRESGYGNRIEIQHANGYITTYSHMSGFARGTGEGNRVKQGQIIGYLGQTGLTTGPHLHYEVMVNGSFVDPMRVKLARTREFDGRTLGEFKRERDRIDALMAQAPNAPQLVAQKAK